MENQFKNILFADKEFMISFLFLLIQIRYVVDSIIQYKTSIQFSHIIYISCRILQVKKIKEIFPL